MLVVKTSKRNMFLSIFISVQYFVLINITKPVYADSSGQGINIQQQQLGLSPQDVMISAGLDGTLYELDWVLETKEFKKAKTEKEREDLLEKAFLSQRRTK